MKLDAEKLIKLGNYWEKGEMKRIYFSDIPSILGLEVVRYKSGSIQSAKLDGHEISNSKAYKILQKYENIKFFYDLTFENFNCRDLLPDEIAEIATKIAAKCHEICEAK